MKNYPKNEKICYKHGFLSVDESFVKACDREFDLRLGEAVANLGADKSVRVIGLTGPTCSGKTTAAKKLISYLGDEQRRVCTVSLDDFFKDQFSREKLVGADPEKLDFDSPDTLDTDALSLFIDDLFTKGIAKKPVFDFVRGIRSNWETAELDGDDVLLLEGIQVLYPAVMSIIESHGGSVLCVRPESGIEVDGKFFDPDFIRLCRRLVRDSNFRGASPEFTMGLWEGVRRNEDENIFPFIDACSVRIDTTLPYELNILAPYLRKLLSKMRKEDKHYQKGMDILDMFGGIEEIDSVAVADNSLYREFV